MSVNVTDRFAVIYKRNGETTSKNTQILKLAMQLLLTLCYCCYSYPLLSTYSMQGFVVSLAL